MQERTNRLESLVIDEGEVAWKTHRGVDDVIFGFSMRPYSAICQK